MDWLDVLTIKTWLEEELWTGDSDRVWNGDDCVIWEFVLLVILR